MQWLKSIRGERILLRVKAGMIRILDEDEEYGNLELMTDFSEDSP